ncbi:MAG: 50S ribosomal protein L24 [Myxococcales bacterium]|jgi:large subunit ribosomal protein L24|nr:50S ribosomal protein L24 [Myxococcales bacterium]
MARIRRDDSVMIIAGKDKGKVGRVMKLVDGGKKILVEKLNIARRHIKRTQQNPQGGIVDKEMPLDISNVALVGPSGKTTRVRFKVETVGGNSVKTRVAVKTNETIG